MCGITGYWVRRGEASRWLDDLGASVETLRHMLRAAATEDGLYLAFPGLLRAGHAPLLIPWDRLNIHSEQTLLGVYILTLDAKADATVDPSTPDESERITLRDGIAAEVKKRLSAPAARSGANGSPRRTPAIVAGRALSRSCRLSCLNDRPDRG